MKSPETIRTASRMDDVQSTIVQVIGDLIRQVPDTISRGQGVVHYEPPRGAIEAAAAALADPATHQYQDGVVCETRPMICAASR